MAVILYKNADWVITMDETRTRVRHGDVLIDGREIRQIGSGLEEKLAGTVVIDQVIDASGKVIIPGFVNVHHHT